MKFVPVALLLLFSATFFSVWLVERASRHLLLFSLSFGLVATAMLVQVAALPPDPGLNTVASAVLYIGGVLVFGEGVLLRSDRRLSRRFQLAALLAVVGVVSYFFYVDRNLPVRIYVLNLGMGGILLYIAWRARFLCRGSRTDRWLFWALLLVALHFFPRTLLTGNVASVSSPDLVFGLTFWGWVQFSLSTLGVAMGLGLLLVTGLDVIEQLRRERDSDPLTRLLNRRGLEAAAPSLADRRRGASPSCVVLCDVDHFKTINDLYGHAAGDTVLVGLAELLQRMARRGDLVARLGGEEFLIAVRNCGGAKAFAFAERLRKAIHQERFEGLPQDHPITCSFGVAEFRPGDDLWTVVERADQNLYKAKRAGRNRSVAEGVSLQLLRA